MFIYWAETVHDGPLSCHLATLTQWPTLGPQNSAIAMHAPHSPHSSAYQLACHLMAVFLAQASTSSQYSRVSKNQRLHSEMGET